MGKRYEPHTTQRGRQNRTRDMVVAGEPSTRGRVAAPAKPPVADDAEAARMREIAARAQADLASVKRRAVREASEAELKVTAKLVLELVPVIDDFERALLAGGVRLDLPPTDDHLLAGISLIYRHLQRVLAGFGVDSFDPTGEPFDPEAHEALTVMTADAPSGTILDTHLRGYRIGDKVLRPARVVVAA